MKPPGLVVRRSRAVSTMNAAMAVLVLAAAIGFLFNRPEGEAIPWLGGAAVIVLIGFHAVQSVRNLLDTSPLLTVGPEGLGLPQATDAPIAWNEVTARGAHLFREFWRTASQIPGVYRESFNKTRPVETHPDPVSKDTSSREVVEPIHESVDCPNTAGIEEGVATVHGKVIRCVYIDMILTNLFRRNQTIHHLFD